MRTKLFILGGLFLLPILYFSCQSTASQQSITKETKTSTSGEYTYEYVTGDDSKTRVYTLENGLKVYMSVYKEEPRITTYIPVKAGGKFDPENSTGLAHYLEHMMFKGTHKFGTKDWEQEKVLLDSIENMFEHYRTLTDEGERKAYYKKIDQISNEASKFAIANEYDKMINSIGAVGTNAYTTTDRTVYINDIPANQLENWLDIESDRFSTIVNRLFHTELEAVYEEKNRSLDNDGWKVFESMYATMFKQHKYGTQTVIGTIEHLKNPSITDIVAYFNKYYIPNNMAICISGDFDPDQAIKLVDQYFGKMKRKDLEEYVSPVEPELTANREVEVFGPEANRLSMGFRFGGTASKDMPKLQMVDYMLSNATAGLIDLNLVQKQKVLSAGCYVDQLNDYSIHTFYGEPRQGQELAEVRDLLLAQIEKIKKGEFEEWLLDAIVNDFKKSRMRQMESNRSRANAMVMAFTNNMTWKDYISLIDEMEKITKEDIVNFVNERYNNYVIVYKKEGEDPNKQKVEKPQITKVDVDRDTQSDFMKNINARKVASIEPVFIDYSKDIETLKMNADIPVLYKKNSENELFTLYYLLDVGTNENPKYKIALDYLSYLGTGDKTGEDLKKEFYKLGCQFNVFSSSDRTYVFLSGLNENMVPAMQLFEELLENPRGDDKVLSNLKYDAHKTRADAKKNKRNILWSGLMNYAKYGEKSPFTNVLNNEQLDALTSEEMLDIIKDITKTAHRVMYYGPMSASDVVKTLNDNHKVPKELKPAPARVKFEEIGNEAPKVFWTNYDMVQAEIIFQSQGQEYDYKTAPEVRMFNEYFGGMSGIVFQEIREAQGLAYSVYSGYRSGNKKEENDYIMAYIGTQADKQEEAMNALVDLLNNFPEAEKTFETAKEAIVKKIESERITKTRVFFNYLDAKEKGLDFDIREKIYSKVKEMTFDDLKAFHTKYIKDKKYNISVVGDRNKLNFKALNKYGEVKELSLDEIFGYKESKKDLLN